jgi:hypothetical protein
MENNVGKWDNWAWDDHLSDISMINGAKFLEDCEIVEDWGTGNGEFKKCRKNAIGVDGSNTPGADKKYVDLVTYISETDGIFLRHVLEHNYEWDKILHNALKSAKKKICIVMFIPFSIDKTYKTSEDAIGVPNLSISKKEFNDILKEYQVEYYSENIFNSAFQEIIYIIKK